MSGHSKWKTIKNKKGKEDAKRAKMFTKIARSIIVAVREGGAEPEYNAALKTAIEKAKAENMPNDNIDRAIKKGAGDLSEGNYENFTYEGYGPEGVAVLVTCLSDNRNRTAPDVRHAFDKCGGNLGQNGSVSFLFNNEGLLVIEREDQDEETLMNEAIELGASDFVAEDDAFIITTELGDFAMVRDGLLDKGYRFSKADLVYTPASYQTISNPDNQAKMEKMIDMLEDLDDVQEVFHNWEGEEE